MPTPPTIALDASPAARALATGTETYARELLSRLPAAAPDLRFRCFADRPADVGLDLTVLPGRRPWAQARLPIELWQRRPDLFFAPSHVVPFLAPGRTLTVVHDLAFERHPAAYHRSARAYLRLTTRWAAVRCPLLIAVSEATARDLAELYRLRPSRVRVVPNGGGEPPAAPPDGPEVDRRLSALGVDRPYLLHVGRVEPRKNQLTGLQAVERLPGLQLVCAGPIVDRALADRLAASARCRLLGGVEAPDLEALYAGAEALVFPSLYEGFGLPVLEAMRRGLPVVTASVSSLPEVGGQAALYVEDPTDDDELAATVERALADRARLAELGLAQAARFTWDRAAQGVAAVIRELVA